MTDYALSAVLRHAYGDDAEDDRGEHESALAALLATYEGGSDDE